MSVMVECPCLARTHAHAHTILLHSGLMWWSVYWISETLQAIS